MNNCREVDYIIITTHSQFDREQNVLLFYFLIIIIKNIIKITNTNALSDIKVTLVQVVKHI